MSILNNPLPISLPASVAELSNSLQALRPNNSEASRLITYALLATALVGLFVYHYIKSQEVTQ